MKKSNILIVLAIILIIGGVGYYEYYQISKHTDNKEEVSEIGKDEMSEPLKDIDINDSIVQELYNNYINTRDSEGYASKGSLIHIMLFEQVIRDEIVTLTNIKSELKNIFALTRENFELNKESCKNYETKITINGMDYWCGHIEYADDQYGITYFDNDDSTKVISEKELKQQVEKMFGPNSYSHFEYFDNIGGPAGKFIYDEKTGNYLMYTFAGGGFAIPPKTKILSASKNKDILTIKVNFKFIDYNGDGIDKIIEVNGYSDEDALYTFKYSEQTESYYFFKAEKINK